MGTNDRIATIDSSAALNVTELRLRNAGGVWSAWQTYAAQAYWTLSPGEGTKTVVDVSGAAVHTLKYRSVDAAGNVEETQIVTVQIDTVAPDIALLGVDDAWHKGPIMALIQANDGLSGLDGMTFNLDGAGWTPGNGVLVSADGDHILQYAAYDRAGNTDATQTAHILIDNRRPTTSGKAVSVVRNKKATFNIKVTDSLPCDPGNATVTIKIRNAAGKVVKTLPSYGPAPTNVTFALGWDKCTLAKGTYRYVVYAVDAAGNAQAKAGGNKLVVK